MTDNGAICIYYLCVHITFRSRNYRFLSIICFNYFIEKSHIHILFASVQNFCHVQLKQYGIDESRLKGRFWW